MYKVVYHGIILLEIVFLYYSVVYIQIIIGSNCILFQILLSLKLPKCVLAAIVKNAYVLCFKFKSVYLL